MKADIAALQRRVGVKDDGVFGPATLAAINAALDGVGPAKPASGEWRKRLQARLGVAQDGVLGPGTYRALFRATAAAGVPDERVSALARGAARYLPEYGIDASPSRMVEFFGECGHETGGWQWLKEVWGPTDAQRRYEGRADLGNTQTGDGKRFLGRGLIQLTGRANYARAAADTGMPLTATPELLEQPDHAVLAACLYWKWRGLNALADTGQSLSITKAINGGTNGLDDRNKRKARMRELVA